MIGGIVQALSGLATSYIDGKTAIQKANAESKLKQATGEINWEQAAIEASKDSWKDEYFTIALSSPIIFIGYAVGVDDPTIIARVEEGFAALSRLPEWYQYLLFIAVSSSFGIKGADKLMSLRKK